MSLIDILLLAFVDGRFSLLLSGDPCSVFPASSRNPAQEPLLTSTGSAAHHNYPHETAVADLGTTGGAYHFSGAFYTYTLAVLDQIVKD